MTDIRASHRAGIRSILVKPLVKHDSIKTQINRGVTLYHIAGGYTGEESCEVMTILTSRELNELSDLVTEIDPKAFMTIARVNEARGRGFSIGKMEP